MVNLKSFQVTARLYGNGEDVIGWVEGVKRFRIPNASSQLTQHLASSIRDTARRYVRERSKYHGKTHGQLEHSIVSVAAANTQYRKGYSVYAFTSYAQAVEEGTKPHDIPNNPFWGLIGKTHPGAKPMHFMRDAFDVELKFFKLRADGAFDVSKWR